MGNGKHFVVVDGLSFLFRAYHAVRGNLSRSDGFPTNALFGFAQMLVKVVDDLKPDLCCVALDSEKKTFRSAVYPEYKANRQPPEENMVRQLAKFPELIQAFGIPAVRVEGVEADDVIATLAEQAREGGNKLTIVSSDKDLMQLLGGEIRMLDTLKDKYFGPEEVVEKFGVGPDKVVEVQALIGDSSDNVPGVKGVGPKTAAELILKYGDLDGIYAHIDEIAKEKLKSNLLEYKELAYLSRELVRLKTDVELPACDLTFNPHLHEAADYLRKELEFSTLAARLEKRRERLMNGQPLEKTGSAERQPAAPGRHRAAPGGAGAEAGEGGAARGAGSEGQRDEGTEGRRDRGTEGQRDGGIDSAWGGYECVRTEEQWRRWLAEIARRGEVAFDTETTSLDPYAARLVGFSLAVEPGKACYVPLEGTEGRRDEGTEERDLFGLKGSEDVRASGSEEGGQGEERLDVKVVLEDLRGILADPKIRVIGHNLKFDWLVMARALGITPTDTGKGLQEMIRSYDDTLLMSASLDGGRWQHGMDALVERHLGHKMISYEDVCGKGKAQVTFDKVPLDAATAYAAEDADATLRLVRVFEGKLGSEDLRILGSEGGYQDVRVSGCQGNEGGGMTAHGLVASGSTGGGEASRSGSLAPSDPQILKSSDPQILKFSDPCFGPACVYAAVERPLLPVIVALEARGVRVDVARLKNLSGEFAARMAELETRIHELAGHPFNVQSTQQLAVVLFDEMGAGTARQQKSRSTAVDVLEDIMERSEDLRISGSEDLRMLGSEGRGGTEGQRDEGTKEQEVLGSGSFDGGGASSSVQPPLGPYPPRGPLAGPDLSFAGGGMTPHRLGASMSTGGGEASRSGSVDPHILRSSDPEILRSLNPALRGSEIARRVLEYRGLAKLRGTYTEALANAVCPLTGRVHTSYAQMGAATGRFSSSDPNLQNIPARTDNGRKIRAAFVAKQGWKMVSADYSQIELRLLAHFSGSVALRAAFAEGLDIHAHTASMVFGVPLHSVTKDQRRAAKVINFGLVYGMGARSMAAQMGASFTEAQAWIDAYFRRYEGVREYMDHNKRQARDKGYVETLLGRRVWLPDIHSPHAGIRAGAERAAINAPLQGSNADIIKLAMVRVEEGLRSEYLRGEGRAPSAQLLMQVHDELVLEAAPERVDRLREKLPPLMTGVVSLAVPLAVEVGVGEDWDAAH